jgi:hypothetical protein
MKITRISKKTLLLPCYFCFTSLFIQQPAVYAVEEVLDQFRANTNGYADEINAQRENLHNFILASMNIQERIALLTISESNGNIPPEYLYLVKLQKEELSDQQNDVNNLIDKERDLIQLIEQQRVEVYKQLKLLETVAELVDVPTYMQNLKTDLKNQTDNIKGYLRDTNAFEEDVKNNKEIVSLLQQATSQFIGECMPSEQLEQIPLDVIRYEQETKFSEMLYDHLYGPLDTFFETLKDVQSQIELWNILVKKNLIQTEFVEHLSDGLNKNQENINNLIKKQTDIIISLLRQNHDVSVQSKKLVAFNTNRGYVDLAQLQHEIAEQRAEINTLRTIIYDLRINTNENNAVIAQNQEQVSAILNSIGEVVE